MKYVAMLCVVALVLSFGVMAQESCCKDGKMCDKCAEKAKCGDKACGDKACGECKDGKMCDKCASEAFKAFMAKMAELGQPGEAHKVLGSGIGTWKAQMKMYDFNGKPACTSEGTCERKWIMNGRFVHEEYKDNSGFVGVCIIGYDNMKKRYVCIWYDNMGTSFSLSEGTYDAASKTFTMMSPETTCPFTGKLVKCKNVTRIIDDKQEVFEMIGIDCASGKEWKMMEIFYTR